MKYIYFSDFDKMIFLDYLKKIEVRDNKLYILYQDGSENLYDKLKFTSPEMAKQYMKDIDEILSN